MTYAMTSTPSAVDPPRRAPASSPRAAGSQHPSVHGCRSCGGTTLDTFLSLGSLPLVDAFPDAESLGVPEPRYPLDVAICSRCSLVQLLEVVSPVELFCRDYPYYSSFSDSWLDHARANVTEQIAARRLGGDSLVLEIGSNDGYLLRFYRQRRIPVLGIDPAAGPAAAARRLGIPTMQRFFDADLAIQLRGAGLRADVIHANNVLAHVPDPNGFLRGIRLLLKPQGVAVFEVPYVKDLVDRCEFDTIYHEHHFYFSVAALAALFRSNQLHLNHVQPLSVHGGSLRLFVGRASDRQESVERFVTIEHRRGVTDLAYYRHFARRVATVTHELLGLLQRLRRGGSTIAAYGAAAKGSLLLNYVGIDRALIDFVADRNVHKHGRFMPGVRIPVVAPDEILLRMPDYLLLLPWNLKDEILTQQGKYRARGGRFIVPIPALEVV